MSSSRSAIIKKLYELLGQHPRLEWPRVCAAVAFFLKKQRMLRQAPKIIAEFEKYVLEQGGQRIVTVETAKPLLAEIRRALVKQLEVVLKKESFLEESIRPELIGGIRLLFDGQVVDASFRRKLQQIFAAK